MPAVVRGFEETKEEEEKEELTLEKNAAYWRIRTTICYEKEPYLTTNVKKLSKGVRLGHVNLEVSNLAVARRFYDDFLSLLGFRKIPLRDRFWVGYRKAHMNFWITSSRPRRATRRYPHIPTNGARDPISDHLGFWVPSLKQLERLEQELIAKGYKAVYMLDKVPTGFPFSQGPSWYVSCSWSDPDNNVIELYTVIRRRK